MNNLCNQPLAQVAEDTFVDLAFVFPVPEEDALPVAEDNLVVRVDFTGPFGGSLWLAVPADMTPEVAGNMLGMDDADWPPSAEQQHDALRELLNVICGNLLPAIAGTQPLFDVHAPRVLDVAELPGTCDDRQIAGTANVPLDSGTAQLVLFLDAGAALRVAPEENAA